jgi:hypothetical protein
VDLLELAGVAGHGWLWVDGLYAKDAKERHKEERFQVLGVRCQAGKRVLPADIRGYTRIEEEENPGILGFWDSGIRGVTTSETPSCLFFHPCDPCDPWAVFFIRKRVLPADIRGYTRIEEEENPGILGFWDSGCYDK